MSRDGLVPPTHPGVELWCDLLCPDCSAILDDIDRLQALTTIRFRHFPLVSHTWAVPAAQVAEEARAQGVLWPVVRAILAANGEVSSPDDLVRMAERGGATPTAVRRALADGRHSGAIARDYHDGRALGITGTPTFVVQGPGGPVRLDGGRTQEGLLDAVEALLDVFVGP
jgi:predicted DsbA family dithiol-disulfide isomerase